MHDLLAGYPVIIEIPVAWGEMDAFQHVNNIVYFRYFESARITYFERTGLIAYMEQNGIGPILASTQCKFKFPLTYPDTVRVGVRVGDLGEDRFTMYYRVVSRAISASPPRVTASSCHTTIERIAKRLCPPKVRVQIDLLEK